MIKIVNTEVFGWEAAIRGMRNPLNSWDKSDSCKKVICPGVDCIKCKYNGTGLYDCLSDDFYVGENDYDLMMRLVKAGTEHRKFMRMIHVQVDVTAPLYWWKEASTYKVGTTANSCSTMHTIHKRPFELDDFSHEHLKPDAADCLDDVIDFLNRARDVYNDTKGKDAWWQMIQLLPSSYNQLRTLDLNYEVLANMYHQRKAHKLDEWRDFCEWIKTLPYAELITGEVE